MLIGPRSPYSDDTGTTSCIPAPTPLYPDITHVYTSATEKQCSYFLPVFSHRDSLFRYFDIKTFSHFLLLAGVLFTENVRSRVT